MLFRLSYSYTFIPNLNFDLLSLSVLLSIFLVVLLLTIFIPWYISTEPGMYQFYMLILVFTISILILSITQVRLIFLIFWEVLRISSYLLVSWWNRRNLANSLALVRLLSSRIGDICLFIVVLGSNFLETNMNSFLILMGFSSKSAQFVFFPWLLRAIERPGPVSALLHSSTLVLAGVILRFRLKETRITWGLIISRMRGVILRVIRTSIFVDIKKRVASSTVYNIGFIFLWIYIREYSILYIHMVFHAVIKASIFVLLRVASHLLNVQDIRAFLGYSHKQIFRLFVCLLAILSLLPLVRVLVFKEARVEIVIDHNVNVWLFFAMYMISCLGFVFFVEYLTLMSKQNINNSKFISFPSYIHFSLIIGITLAVLLIFFLPELTIRNISIFTNYTEILLVSLILCLYISRRSSLLEIQYVSKYNSFILGNLNSIKKQFMRIEFFLLVHTLKKTEWSMTKHWHNGSKLNYSAIFILATIILALSANI